jgi:glutamate 5-kinase
MTPVEAVADPEAEAELPGEGEGEEKEPELFVEGSGQISMLPGGEEALASEMTLQGGSINVEGQFDKGEFLDLSVRVRVAEVAFVDKYGGDEVIDTVRRHKAKIVRLERV